MRRKVVSVLLFAAGGVVCIGLVVSAVRARQQRALPVVSVEPASIQGFHTTLYRGEHLRLRISADSVTVSSPKVLGPFSLGFLRSIVARNVTLDTYPNEEERPGAMAYSLREIPALMAQQRKVEIAAAELMPVKVVEHRRGEPRVVLTAASCDVGLTSTEFVCHDGVVDSDGTSVRFHKLSYDGEVHLLTAGPMA